MSKTATFEPASELVNRALQAGFTVSTDQIARWNRAGLLPTPMQSGRGQGNGSDVKYPERTGDQLVTLCGIHEHYRKLAQVGWYLWLNGFPVHPKYSEKPLVAAIDKFVECRAAIKTKLIDGSFGVPTLRRSGEKLLTGLGEYQSENSQFRRIRRRVHKDQTAEFFEVVLTLAIGIFRPNQEPNDKDKAEQLSLFEKGLGLTGARTEHLPNGETLMSGDIGDVLAQFATAVAKLRKSTMLKYVRSGQVVVARDELRLLLHGLRIVHEFFRPKRKAFGLTGAADVAKIKDIPIQALMIILFASVIQCDPTNQLRIILNAVKEQLLLNGHAPTPAQRG